MCFITEPDNVSDILYFFHFNVINLSVQILLESEYN